MHDDSGARLVRATLAFNRQYCLIGAWYIIGNLHGFGIVKGLILAVEGFEEGVAKTL